MSSETIIKAEGVSKKFCKSLKRSMIYAAKDIVRETLGITPPTEQIREDEFWAVDDVSFEVRRGECLGLIGPNGAGKTTLLKMLSGIILPDTGLIEVHGRVGALIELGAGFHPMLTGRENIYINGSILGLTRKEIDAKFESIVDFAELEDFIDTPVKFYSSGMYVRLGFAVAAHLEPDVLLIDEVLAVGDVGFRSKCYGRISELLENCAVIFVSHFMPNIAKLCNNVTVLNDGRVFFSGSTVKGVEQYNNIFSDQKMTTVGTGEAEIANIRLLNQNDMVTDEFSYNEPFQVVFDVDILQKYETYLVSLSFINRDTNIVAQCHSEYNNVKLYNRGKRHSIKVEIDNLILNPGKYYLNIIIFDETNVKHLVWISTAKKFTVKGDFHGGAPIQFQCDWQVID